jgi:polyphosphate kinase
LWAKDTESGAVFAFFLDDLLLAHLPESFGTRGAAGLVRVTRDGDFTVDLEEEDTESIPDVVRSGLGGRERGRPVRLQFHGDVTQQQLTALMNALRLVTGQVLPAPGSLCLQGLWVLVSQISEEVIAGSHLRHQPLVSTVPRPLRKPETIFDRLKKDDFLLHHPYDSFDAFVAWIRAACVDPQVTMIEQTVYRMDAVSPLIEALKEAASRKKVRVIIELRARFDELNNLRLADELRAAGVEVSFGFGKLKLHAKVALITRKEEEGERLYTHLSTGNYNAATARQYTDLAILTAHPEIGLDARAFFDKVFKGEVPTSFRQLVAAPGRLHRKLVGLIQAEKAAAEAGHPARIVAKVNALVDEAVIEQLYLASGAGVRIDLIVRGACSLIPGVKGLSENIRVISVVDRLLEHSRLYYFGHTRALYLSSADWMPRNFFSRLELAFPILDPLVFRYIEEEIIPAYLSDTVKAKELTSVGTWKKRTVRGGPGRKHVLVRSQGRFESLAREEYRGTSLE